MLKGGMNKEKHDSLNSKSQLILLPLPLRCQSKRLIAEDDVGTQHLEAAPSVLIISADLSYHRETKTAALLLQATAFRNHYPNLAGVFMHSMVCQQ